MLEVPRAVQHTHESTGNQNESKYVHMMHTNTHRRTEILVKLIGDNCICSIRFFHTKVPATHAQTHEKSMMHKYGSCASESTDAITHPQMHSYYIFLRSCHENALDVGSCLLLLFAQIYIILSDGRAHVQACQFECKIYCRMFLSWHV